MEKIPNKYINYLKVAFLLVVMLQVSSCILFKKKCPLPTCETAKMHRHLLIFHDTPKKKKKSIKKQKKDSTKAAIAHSDSLLHDSLGTEAHDHKKHKRKHKGEEHEASYIEVDGEVLDEEGNVYVEPKEEKRKARAERKAARKARKKKKKEDKLRIKGKYNEEEEEVEEEEEDEYHGMSEEEYRKQRVDEHAGDTTSMHNYNEKELAKKLRKEDKASKKAARKEARKARVNKRGEADYTRLYRSRVTKWWRRDQNPKTGKYYKRKGDAGAKSK